MKKLNITYILLILILLFLALSYEYWQWIELLSFHKVSLPSLYFPVSLSIAYYLLLFAFFLVFFSSRYLIIFSFLLLLLHTIISTSEFFHFFQYGVYISKEGLELFLQSRGEVSHMIKTGIGEAQRGLIIQVVLSNLTWFSVFALYVYLSKKFTKDFQEKRNFIFHQLGLAFFFLFICISIFFYNKSLANPTIAKEMKTSGTIASHIYVAGLGHLKLDASESGSTDVRPEVFIDKTSFPGPKPNIVLILMDSIRADHLPDYGYHRNTTPFIKSMSNDFIKVDYCYAQANATAKSFPSLILSKYPRMDKTNYNWGIFKQVENAGYTVAVSSSMDLHWASIIRLFQEKSVKRVFHAGKVSEKHYIWGHNKEATYNYGVDDGFNVQEVKKWLMDLPRPFFLIVHLHSAHYSYEVPKKYEVFQPLPRYRAAPPWKPMVNAYDNAIYRVDDAVRELFDSFKEHKLMDDLVVAITADHGEAFEEHPGSFYHQTSVYESQVRVPLFFYIGKNMSRTKYMVYKGSKRIAGLVDLMPTLFQISGISLAPQFEGVPIWGDSAKSFETMISYMIRREFGIRMGKWKYIKKFTQNQVKLFDIEKDPKEENNLSKEHPELVKQFEEIYKKSRKF